MTLEDAVRLLMPAGELGDEVHEVILECKRKGLIRIESDGTLVLTESGRRATREKDKSKEGGNEKRT